MSEFVKTVYAQAVNTDFGTASNVGEYISKIFIKLIPAVGGLAVLMMIYAGYLYMTSQGNSEQINKAKDIILGVIFGIILLFTIEVLLKNVVGVK